MITSDVYLASACLALGYKLETVDRKDPRHMKFEFSETGFQSENLPNALPLLDSIETQWANRTLTVNAFDFSEAIKRMKSLIHSS